MGPPSSVDRKFLCYRKSPYKGGDILRSPRTEMSNPGHNYHHKQTSPAIISLDSDPFDKLTREASYQVIDSYLKTIINENQFAYRFATRNSANDTFVRAVRCCHYPTRNEEDRSYYSNSSYLSCYQRKNPVMWHDCHCRPQIADRSWEG